MTGYRHAARATGGQFGNAAGGRYPSERAAQMVGKSRRQVSDELYGMNNPDEWSEAYLESLLGDLLKAYGLYSYHTKRSDRSDKGYPDETIIGGREVLWVELKNAQRKLEPEQVDVVHRINAAGGLVRIYRPADWISGAIADEIRDVARGPGCPAEPWEPGTFRCGCEIVLVHTDGHRTGCPIERAPRKTDAGRVGRPWWWKG